jgi:hypothetical protein
MFYFVAMESMTHALLLEQRMKCAGVVCELAYTPREIMTGLCNMGVRFEQGEYRNALSILRRSGLPGCRLFREVMRPDGADYYEEIL